MKYLNKNLENLKTDLEKDSISFNSENNIFRITGKGFPVIKGTYLLDSKKTESEYYGFGWIQKENVISKHTLNFFSLCVTHSYICNIIYFNVSGYNNDIYKFSVIPTENYIIITKNDNPYTGDAIEGTIKGVAAALFFAGKNGEIDTKELKIMYIKKLLKEGLYYSNMYSGSDDGYNYFYGKIFLDQNVIMAEILNDKNKEIEIVEINDKDLLYAVTSKDILLSRMVEYITKILKDG